MLYFFHHYELPAILQQAEFQQFLVRSQRDTARTVPAGIANNNPLTTRITQLLSTLRPTATTQTSTTVSQVTAVATAVSHVATSTSATATVTVGTTAQPITSSQTSQTTPTAVESAAAQTRPIAATAVAASQTIDAPQARPTGGSDEPF